MAEGGSVPSSGAEALSSDVSSLNKKPTCIICLGMAGSGKTTFVQVKFLAKCWLNA